MAHLRYHIVLWVSLTFIQKIWRIHYSWTPFPIVDSNQGRHKPRVNKLTTIFWILALVLIAISEITKDMISG